MGKSHIHCVMLLIMELKADIHIETFSIRLFCTLARVEDHVVV